MRWFIVDGGSVNGTFLRRGGELQLVGGRTALQRRRRRVCARVGRGDGRATLLRARLPRHAGDSQATRAVPVRPPRPSACLAYDMNEARLVLVHDGEQHEIQIRAQAHRLVRYMVERNVAGRRRTGALHARRVDARRLGGRADALRGRSWRSSSGSCARSSSRSTPTHLIENERRLGYRLRTCGARPVTPDAGETFGGYTIESVLGRGGMGTVYLATHERLARKVALEGDRARACARRGLPRAVSPRVAARSVARPSERDPDLRRRRGRRRPLHRDALRRRAEPAGAAQRSGDRCP